MAIDTRLVFTHIPKTAGSSVNVGIYAIVGGAPNMWVKTSANSDLSGFAPRRVVAGHIRFPDAYERVGDVDYIAALRDPVDRVLSHFFFVIRENGLDRSILKGGLREGFWKFYEIINAQEDGQNLQCRFFSRDCDADQAIATIRKHYCLVWDIEKTDRAWPVIANLTERSSRPRPLRLTAADLARVPPLSERAYEAPTSSSVEDQARGARPQNYSDWLSAEEIGRIRDDNAEDVRLHAWLKARGGLFIAEDKIVVPDEFWA